MKLQRSTSTDAETTVALSTIQPGDVFRFASDSFEDALKTDAFWLRVESPEQKESCLLVNLKDEKRVVRDPTHRVVKHEVWLSIAP